MRPASWSGALGPPAAPAVRDGVVSRPGLFELLGSAERVAEVSASPGSGKTFLLRSDQAGLKERAAWVPVQGEERDPQTVLALGGRRAAGHRRRVEVGAAPDGSS